MHFSDSVLTESVYDYQLLLLCFAPLKFYSMPCVYPVYGIHFHLYFHNTPLTPSRLSSMCRHRQHSRRCFRFYLLLLTFAVATAERRSILRFSASECNRSQNLMKMPYWCLRYTHIFFFCSAADFFGGVALHSAIRVYGRFYTKLSINLANTPYSTAHVCTVSGFYTAVACCVYTSVHLSSEGGREIYSHMKIDDVYITRGFVSVWQQCNLKTEQAFITTQSRNTSENTYWRI